VTEKYNWQASTQDVVKFEKQISRQYSRQQSNQMERKEIKESEEEVCFVKFIAQIQSVLSLSLAAT